MTGIELAISCRKTVSYSSTPALHEKSYGVQKTKIVYKIRCERNVDSCTFNFFPQIIITRTARSVQRYDVSAVTFMKHYTRWFKYDRDKL
jgi:hypothetical protein